MGAVSVFRYSRTDDGDTRIVYVEVSDEGTVMAVPSVIEPLFTDTGVELEVVGGDMDYIEITWESLREALEECGWKPEAE